MRQTDEVIYKRIPWIDWPTCDPTILGKRIAGDKPRTTLYHCRRLSCPNCGPVMTVLRARKLLWKLSNEGLEKLWFGEVDEAALKAIREWARCHSEEKRLVTLYYNDLDLRTVLATADMAPRRKGMLRPVAIEEAVIDKWYKYAATYRLRKNPHDDWNITDHQWIDWVDDGPKWDIVETDQRMDRIHGYIPNEPVPDAEHYKQRFRRIRRDLTNPPESTYLDS